MHGCPTLPPSPNDKDWLANLEHLNLRCLYDEIVERQQIVFSPSLFEITDISQLPKSLLSVLSIKPGESVLRALNGSKHDDLSPLSTSYLHYKPFMEVNGRYYTFFHSGFNDYIGDIIEEEIYKIHPGLVSEFGKAKADRLEEDSMILLSSLIHPDFIHPNVFIQIPMTMEILRNWIC